MELHTHGFVTLCACIIAYAYTVNVLNKPIDVQYFYTCLMTITRSVPHAAAAAAAPSNRSLYRGLIAFVYFKICTSAYILLRSGFLFSTIVSTLMKRSFVVIAIIIRRQELEHACTLKSFQARCQKFQAVAHLNDFDVKTNQTNLQARRLNQEIT